MKNIKYFILLFWITVSHNFTIAAQIPGDNKVAFCGAEGDCHTVVENCTEKCGCDKSLPYTYDELNDECVLDIALLTKEMEEKYNTEEKIRLEAEATFRGILFSCWFFLTCASICAVTACIYCCHINYSDYTVSKELKELTKKVGKKGENKPTKSAAKEPLAPIAESCNVVVEDAGLFVC